MTEQALSIKKDAKLLAEKIRKYCQNQRHLWKRVPALALKADGRTGFSDILSTAYNFKLWRVQQISSFICLDIDLRTGELCLGGDVKRLARDEEIISLAFQLDNIDASKILANLKKTATSSTDHSVVYAKQDPRWRENIAKNLGFKI